MNILIYLQKWLERLNCYHWLFVWSSEFNSHETISVWLGTVNPKHVFFNNASYFQSIWYSTYVEMTRFIPHKFTHGVWMYIYMSFKLISLLPFTHRYYHLHWNWNLGKLRRSHFNMDGSQLWVVPVPPRNTLSEKRENETGRLHYKVQNANLPLCFLTIFNFLVKNLSNLPVMNIKRYQHAWD